MSLLRYFKSASTDNDAPGGDDPGVRGKRGQSETSAAGKKDYENKKRKRQFVPSWSKEFPWLDLNKEKNVMVCRVCNEFSQQADKESPFYLGTSTFRKSSIKTHATSKAHAKCELAKRARETPRSTPMAQTVAKMNKDNFEVLKKLFRTAYYVAKEEIAMAKFSSLCKLQISNGVNMNNTYLNDHACRNFIGAMAHVHRLDTTSQIEKSRFLSVLSDGSTDNSVIEQELVYVRFLCNGKPQTKMVKIVDLKHAHAVGILDAIDRAVKDVGITLEIWHSKVVCANFDGASVMMGEINGVAGQLKRRVPHIVVLHCVAHKLELAVLDAVKRVAYLQKFDDTLKAVFKMYYRSPKKRRELKDIGEIVEEKVCVNKACHKYIIKHFQITYYTSIILIMMITQ